MALYNSINIAKSKTTIPFTAADQWVVVFRIKKL
jgi:hypothetical protein